MNAKCILLMVVTAVVTAVVTVVILRLLGIEGAGVIGGAAGGVAGALGAGYVVSQKRAEG